MSEDEVFMLYNFSMNIFKQHYTYAQTRDSVSQPVVWAYDQGCYRVGTGAGLRHKTLQFSQQQPGEAGLDVGCSTGRLTGLATQAVGFDTL